MTNDSNLDFNKEVQELLLSFMTTDSAAFVLSQNIIKPEYFDPTLRKAVKFIINYSNEFKSIPRTEQIKATSGVQIEAWPDNTDAHLAWYLDTIEKFCRFKAMEAAVLDGPDLLMQGRGGEVMAALQDAMTITLTRDLGTSYFRDVLVRLERMRDHSNFISTGWKSLDEKLYGGFTKGGLNVFAGGSGSGKSLWLQNLALNWAFAGMHVIYFSLELSEDLVAMRMDAMVSGIGTKEILKDSHIKQVAMKVQMKGKGTGSLTIKRLFEGTTANDIRAFIKEYEIQNGFRPGAIVVDYLDLMHPSNVKINPSDMFVKDKYTSEELRSVAGEYDILCATASQLNRQSVDAQEFDHSHIAGGISKINTADNVFGLLSTASMKERGVYQLQFLKTRSSSAVGQKIELAYDPVTMRITDSEEDMSKRRTGSEIQNEIKSKMSEEKTSDPVEEKGVGMRTDIQSLMQRLKKDRA